MFLKGFAVLKAGLFAALLVPGLSSVSLPMREIVALLVATSFAAGLNTYATVGTLGILGRYHVLILPEGLNLLAHGWVIAAAAVMFGIEFFADKIPAFDL